MSTWYEIDTIDAATDEWMRSIDPDPDPRVWPSPTEGRYRGTLRPLSAVDELEGVERCSHCRIGALAYRRTRRWGQDWRDLCERCRKYVIRNGQLPSRRLNYLQARRVGRLDDLEVLNEAA